MYALLVTVLYSLAILGSAKKYSVKLGECCRNIGAFRECKRECKKVWREKTPGRRVALALSLPKVCPSHLNNLWKCMSSSVKGLHPYMNKENLSGKSCCLLAIDAVCRNDCFEAINFKNLQQSCPPEEEKSLLRCIDRTEASQKCCQASKTKCVKACQIVFSSDKKPNRKKIEAVTKKCGKNHVFKCVKNVTESAVKATIPGHRCCQMTHVKNCQDVCKKVMSSQNSGEEKIGNLSTSCLEHHPNFHDKIWECFLTYAVPAKTKDAQSQNPVVQPDVRLHCCLRAKTELCLKLCLKRHSKGGEAIQEFHNRCQFNPLETTMLTCLADVSAPCRIGCSGLQFCRNFNHRHTELFRSCNKEADIKAKYDFENWRTEGRVDIPAMDVIPVKDIKTCLPDMWKGIACVLQIKPCNAKSHGSVICRKDCLKVLNECAKKEQLGVRSVEMICKSLSPDEQSSCISIEDYIKPSLFKKEVPEVTHPCYPNPCKNKDVCEINRESPGKNSKNFVPYRCTPGCSIDLQSNLLIRNGDLARLPIVRNSKLEGCYKICRCDQEQLSNCPRLPNCVKRKSCRLKGSKEIYKHLDTFYINCKSCSCFDGDVLCSKEQCFLAEMYNGTGRPRRNHSPKDGSNEPTGLPCSCSATYEPACGTNGKTYRNFCFARCAGLKQHHILKRACSSRNPCIRSPCDVKNEFCVIDRRICIGTTSICPQHLCVPKRQYCSNVTTELICDNENKQHFNRCSIYELGKEIAYSGFCQNSCAPDNREVCGIDGQTYNSICALNHARMLMDYEGRCKTVGKYASKDPTARCAHIICPVVKPDNCVGVTPPGACCKICATQLTVLISEKEVNETNMIVMHQAQPITQKQVVSRVRRHLSVSECDLFGFYSIYGDFILLVKAITENPTELQFTICNNEAQKIETLIRTASPMFTSDGILSFCRAASLTTPKLSADNTATLVCYSHSLLLLVSLLLSWPR